MKRATDRGLSGSNERNGSYTTYVSRTATQPYRFLVPQVGVRRRSGNETRRSPGRIRFVVDALRPKLGGPSFNILRIRPAQRFAAARDTGIQTDTPTLAVWPGTGPLVMHFGKPARTRRLTTRSTPHGTTNAECAAEPFILG